MIYFGLELIRVNCFNFWDSVCFGKSEGFILISWIFIGIISYLDKILKHLINGWKHYNELCHVLFCAHKQNII